MKGIIEFSLPRAKSFRRSQRHKKNNFTPTRATTFRWSQRRGGRPTLFSRCQWYLNCRVFVGRSQNMAFWNFGFCDLIKVRCSWFWINQCCNSGISDFAMLSNSEITEFRISRRCSNLKIWILGLRDVAKMWISRISKLAILSILELLYFGNIWKYWFSDFVQIQFSAMRDID